MNRFEILEGLACFRRPLSEFSKELSKLDWDYEGEPFIITDAHVSNILNDFLSGRLDASQVEEWANLIECREDLDFEGSNKKNLESVIYDLANPALQGEITEQSCKILLTKLS